jgi:membrane protease YdiL (CAAX protease family)
MKNKTYISIITILAFMLIKNTKFLFLNTFYSETSWVNEDLIVKYLLVNISQFVFMFAVAWMMLKKPAFVTLGLSKGFGAGLIWGLIFTLPMFMGYGLAANFNNDLDLLLLYRNIVGAGFAEELIFRAFLMGILFIYGGWGFIPSALITALFFGASHLYQAEDLGSAVSVFLVTAIGSAGFGWFYFAWKSLWMPVFLHAFMDLSWDMFNISSAVTGSLYANIFRILTLVFAIVISIKKAKQNSFYSLKDKLWLNESRYSIE